MVKQAILRVMLRSNASIARSLRIFCAASKNRKSTQAVGLWSYVYDTTSESDTTGRSILLWAEPLRVHSIVMVNPSIFPLLRLT
jgi:hypothetical protein